MALLIRILGVALGGALGAVLRWLLGAWVQRLLGLGFPWGTAAVNLLGCLCFGLFWGAAEGRISLESTLRFFVLTGFMGAFTTFSTFAYDSFALLQGQRILLGVGNILLQNGVGIAALALGLWLGRAL